MKISVLGGGSWGIALSSVLAENNHKVNLYIRNKDQIDYIKENNHSNKYIKDYNFSENIILTNDIESTFDSDVIVLSIPLQKLPDVLEKMKGKLDDNTILVNSAKGIHVKNLKCASDICHDYFPNNKFVVLSGPSHAEEVSKKLLTSVVSASKDIDSAILVQDLFMNDYFRVYIHTDVKGVELSAALKNVIAIASGILTGLGQGDNARAALISRGLFEIFKLAKKMGCDMQTFMGLAGVGDLIVTATSIHSRNYKAGLLLAKGKNIKEIEEEIGMVVEGVMTTESAYKLSKIHDVSMPITEALYKVLFEGRNPNKSVMELMGRSKKHEFLENMEL